MFPFLGGGGEGCSWVIRHMDLLKQTTVSFNHKTGFTRNFLNIYYSNHIRPKGFLHSGIIHDKCHVPHGSLCADSTLHAWKNLLLCMDGSCFDLVPPSYTWLTVRFAQLGCCLPQRVSQSFSVGQTVRMLT